MLMLIAYPLFYWIFNLIPGVIFHIYGTQLSLGIMWLSYIFIIGYIYLETFTWKQMTNLLADEKKES